MIASHRERLRALSDDALERVAEIMDVPPAEFVIDHIESRGLCQADVVMALLRAPRPVCTCEGEPLTWGFNCAGNARPSRAYCPACDDGLAPIRIVEELARVTVAKFARPWPRPLPPTPHRLPPGLWWVAWHARDLNLGGRSKCEHCEGQGDTGPAKSAEGDWLDQPCPKCHGSGRNGETRRVRVANGMTVDELVAAGVTRAQLTGAVRGGHLRMSGEPR